MFFLGNFIFALAKILGILLTVYFWLIVARALISWVNPDPYNAIVQFLQKVTEPVLAPIRSRLAPLQSNIGIDFSPFIVALAIMFLQNFLVVSLIDLACRFK